MSAGSRGLMVAPLVPSDVVGVAQCIVIDADVFPYASAHFGNRPASAYLGVARERGDARVLGFVSGHVRRGAMHLDGLAVDRAVRRRGIGRALVRAAVEGARVRGLHGITLHVSVANRGAIALYLTEGFAIEHRLAGLYPPAAFGGEADGYEMALSL